MSVAAWATPHHKIGRPYQVDGQWYVPHVAEDYDETGQASWYGQEFHGRATANGEVFDMNELSAAHPTLPLPSRVEVTNLENGRTLILRVNDRGPFKPGRIIDLSKAAAKELGVYKDGVAKVRVRYLGPARLVTAKATSKATESAPSAGRYLQIGAFGEPANAQRAAARVGEGVAIQPAVVNGRTIHRVLVGPVRADADLADARRRVAKAGFSDSRVVTLD